MIAIETRGLKKVYPPPPSRRRGNRTAGGSPGGVVALDGLDLDVNQGEFFGLLGPNGAGKTTTIGILTTRVRPTAGDARVAGADVITDAVRVRRRIGVVPQRPNPDRSLNAEENLLFHAAYFGLDRAVAQRRAAELLAQFDIADKALSKIDEMSGGQQQRLMIARALIHEPEVLFLDEPTVGLDPQARLALWDVLRLLQSQGRTIILTTHYMEEADRLCDRVAIVDHGRLLAIDSPAALKRRAPGGTLVEIAVDRDAAPFAESARALPNVERAEAAGALLRVYSPLGGSIVARLIQLVEERGGHVKNITLAEPSLETLFVSLTGRKLD
ncbi:MAG TPA: ATP-binding cassette domain-containing protein [Gemmatimonadaceae bacterium]|nr:ATP-binding cassette domain-containing protein [Gemmatimonadaceae bacterium]